MQVGVDLVAGEFSTDPLVFSPCRHKLRASKLLSCSLTLLDESLELVERSELATDDLTASGLEGVTLLPGEVSPEGIGWEDERGSTPELVALLRLVREPSESMRGRAVVVPFWDEVTAALDVGEVHIRSVSDLLGLPQGLGSARKRSSSLFIRRSRTSSLPISQSNL
jgi:hypothetical protein